MTGNQFSFQQSQFQRLRDHLLAGRALICPTDTIPGFTADPSLSSGVKAICDIKGRPPEKPFLLLVADFLMAERYCLFSNTARGLVNRFWPGPLTLLVPRKNGALPDFFPHAPELAVRMPGNQDLLKFLHFYGKPLTSTSVNIAGQPPLTDFDTIIKHFGDFKNLVFAPGIKENMTRADMASTIVRVENGEVCLVRQGKIPQHEITKVQ